MNNDYFEGEAKLGLFCGKDENNFSKWYLSTLKEPRIKIWLNEAQSLDMIAEVAIQKTVNNREKDSGHLFFNKKGD